MMLQHDRAQSPFWNQIFVVANEGAHIDFTPPVGDIHWAVAAAMSVVGDAVQQRHDGMTVLEEELCYMTAERNTLAAQLNQAHKDASQSSSKALQIIMDLQQQLQGVHKQQEDLHAMQLMDKEKSAKIAALEVKLNQIQQLSRN